MSSNRKDKEQNKYHALETNEVLRLLDVDRDLGLSTDEVMHRRELWGKNILATDSGTSPVAMLVRQFTDMMIVVLIIAAVVAGLIGDTADAIAILVIVVLNAVIGFIQEYRAERALQLLQQRSAPYVLVIREGRRARVAEAKLVPGDIVMLEAGNMVPADLRIIDTDGLMMDEAALTGESLSVAKQADSRLAANTPLGERINLAHKGTHVTNGRATCVVVATGAKTEIGRIAQLMHESKRPMTPLQKRLAGFGRKLSAIALTICTLILVAGLLRGEPPLLMLLTAISLAVAAIPEALPAVVTITLALGAKHLARHNALIRRLPAVETLGSVTIICCDKTGTLTENSMRAERFHTPTGDTGALPSIDKADNVWLALGRAMILNNDATMDVDGIVQSDPTELAILEAAEAAGFSNATFEIDYPRTANITFDARRRRMTTIHRVATGGGLVIVKGAPEEVLSLCRDQQTDGGVEPLDRGHVLMMAQEIAQSGYRVLAFAEKTINTLPSRDLSVGNGAEEVERDLTFLGMVALADPPRARAKDALASCVSAGIEIAMITGDHPATAKAIAARLGMATASDDVLTGLELQALPEAERNQAISKCRIYARVSPEQKFDIVTALQAHGQFVAMTGDGVNDAPALKQADIGVAMGLKGTDVAREAADAVLLDDDFATIVDAVREGRRIYDNIRKFIKYTMTSNAGEIWTIVLAIFIGLPLPLLPIQILWINLVTDGLPGLALAGEPAERNIMNRPPRPPRERVFSHGMWQHMLWIGLLIGCLSLGAQFWAYNNGSENWQSVVFTVLTFSQLVHVMAIRSDWDSIFVIGWFSNLPLLGAVMLTIGLQLAIVYVEPLQTIFHTSSLTPTELLVSFGLPLVVLVAVEIEKWLFRRGLIYQY